MGVHHRGARPRELRDRLERRGPRVRRHAHGPALEDDVTTAFLNDLAAPLAASCQVAKQAEPYNDGLYAGFFSTFGNCNGGDTFGIVVVAQDPEFSHFVYLRGKFVSEQDKGDTFNLIFTTFQSTQGLEQASDDEDRAFVPGR
ncbi:MAG: hypothetical protein R2717_02475 [Schumannella sp.]